MGAMPGSPATMERQDSAVPMLFGVTRPMPVMTTLSMENRCSLKDVRGTSNLADRRTDPYPQASEQTRDARQSPKRPVGAPARSGARLLLLRVLLDVVDRVLDRADFLGVLVRDVDLEGLFEGENELDEPE